MKIFWNAIILDFSGTRWVFMEMLRPVFTPSYNKKERYFNVYSFYTWYEVGFYEIVTPGFYPFLHPCLKLKNMLLFYTITYKLQTWQLASNDRSSPSLPSLFTPPQLPQHRFITYRRPIYWSGVAKWRTVGTTIRSQECVRRALPHGWGSAVEASNAMKAIPPGRGAAAIAVIAAIATIARIAV